MILSKKRVLILLFLLVPILASAVTLEQYVASLDTSFYGGRRIFLLPQ
jgi:hypothetical protein